LRLKPVGGGVPLFVRAVAPVRADEARQGFLNW
jgi:hypothetical protein